jgi:hypothetical protein
MKTMLLAFATIVLITIAASYALQSAGFSSQAQNQGPAVRLDQ